ncbi:hypothetical protein [Fodinicola feengrottensis]|nr:hypothetical protein [Fodinicola feengrottensis]
MTAQNVSKAFNGGTITINNRLIGSATIVASTGVFTTTAPHLLVVGNPVVLGAITTTTGVTAGTTYYVRTVPSGTAFTLSTTLGGSALSLTSDGSTVSVTEVGDTVSFEPPVAGVAATRVMIGWEAADHKERWIFRKCLQTGKVKVARQKSPNKATIPMSFMLEVVDGALPFKAIFGS